MTYQWRHVAIPEDMRDLERDRRGYPIPHVVMRDQDGRPHFTINDQEKVHQVVRAKLCALCAKPITRGFFFVGGPMACLHPQGAFVDPPAHRDCAIYALQVCPYLAAPSYAGRIDDLTLAEGKLPTGVVISKDEAMNDERPPIFGLGGTLRFGIIPQPMNQFYMKPDGWFSLSFWRQGVEIGDVEARSYLNDDLEKKGVV